MAKHNPTDDVTAREALRSKLAGLLQDHGYGDMGGDVDNLAAIVADAFPFVELDRQRTNLPGGQKVHLKRLVVTGQWEVDPNGQVNALSGIGQKD